MCKFKSAVVTREGNVYHHDLTDSHAEIQTLFGLKDRGDDIACIEYSPSGPDDDLASYSLRLDQERVPLWWSDEFAAMIAGKMKAIISGYIVTDDVLLAIGRRLIIRDKRILEARHCIVTAYGSCKITGYGSCEITGSGSCKITDKRVKK